MVIVDYGLNFKNARERKRMSQADAAAALNISPSFLSQVENGKKKPNVDLIFKAANIYGVETGFFFKAKEKVNVDKLNTKENQEFISDLGRLSTEELKQKYDMTFLGDEITESDLKAMIAYLKTLKSLD